MKRDIEKKKCGLNSIQNGNALTRTTSNANAHVEGAVHFCQFGRNVIGNTQQDRHKAFKREAFGSGANQADVVMVTSRAGAGHGGEHDDVLRRLAVDPARVGLVANASQRTRQQGSRVRRTASR